MVTVAICDDEQKFRKSIRACCQSYFEEKEIACEIKEYASGEEFLMGKYPDILLLDVTMKRISGLMVRDILASSYANTRILFVAENGSFMSKAFGRNVYGFLKKPLCYEQFAEKMEEILCDIKHSRQFIYCKKGKEIELVHLKRILYLETVGRYMRIYLQGEKESRMSDKGIREMCDILSEFHFVRCSRTQLVNLQYVTKVHERIELINGESLSLTECYKRGFYDEYDKWGGKL